MAAPVGTLVRNPPRLAPFLVRPYTPPSHYGPPSMSAPSFPANPLSVQVQLNFGADLTLPEIGEWVDVGPSVRVADGIRIRKGSSDEAGITPAQCTFVLNNLDGRFTPNLATSPHYPNVRRNTPLRVRVVTGTGVTERFSGHVSEWVPRWDLSGNLATVGIEADGVLRRIRQGESPVRSPLRHTISGDNPPAYWPLEDEADSVTAASAVAGQAAMAASGGLQFANFASTTTLGFTGRYGTANLPNLKGGGSFTAATISGGSATEWAVQLWSYYPVSDDGSNPTVVMARLETPSGSYVRWDLRNLSLGAGLGVEVVAYDGFYVPVTVLSAPGSGYPGFSEYRFDAIQSGPDILLRLYANDDFLDSATLSGATLSAPTSIKINADNTVTISDFAVGHVQVWNSRSAPRHGTFIADAYGGGSYALVAYESEPATDRIVRLCADAGLPVTVPAPAAAFITRMGSQPDGSVLDVIDQCRLADSGNLYEAGFGLQYVPRLARYNADVAMSMTFNDLIEPPQPTFDDQKIRNDVTLKRPGGSSGVYADQDHIDANGRYDESVDVNVDTDAQLVHMAEWRVHLGTIDTMRWPRLSFDLAANTDLIDDWLAAGITSRITVSSPLATVDTAGVDVFLEGYEETLDPYSWRVDMNCSPAAPWTVIELDASRLDTGGSTLAAAVDSTATSLSVATTTGPVWSTTATPYDIGIAGERMTVTACSGASSPQTLTVTRSVNSVAKAQVAGASVALWEPAVIAR